MQMHQVPSHRMSLRCRVKLARQQWPDSIFIGVLLAFITALALLLNPVLHTVNDRSAWRALGPLGSFLTGVAFAALVAFAVAKPRYGGYAATFVVCVIGVALALHPFHMLGVGFYAVVLGVATYATWLQEKFLAWIEALRERDE